MTTLTVELTGDQVVALMEQLPPAERNAALTRFVVSGGALEEYFSFLAPDDIRLRGTRIGIESILIEYGLSERLHRIYTERTGGTGGQSAASGKPYPPVDGRAAGEAGRLSCFGICLAGDIIRP